MRFPHALSHRALRLVAAAVAAFALALAAPVATLASTVTTSGYDQDSTSEDIAVSCRALQIGSSNGVLSGECNKTSSGAVSPHNTSIDLDDVIYCEMATSGPALAWGTTSYDGSITGWSVSTDSVGDDYVVSGKCAMTGADTTPTTYLDIGDTTNGLKNSDGGLAKR